ncbi:MAG: TM2 domain-containing protein [Proteobacteria bacterium]|nr:TM2 domain-containing protein [Pseudomonadota bacterium]
MLLGESMSAQEQGMPGPGPVKARHSRVTAALLAILLGWLGAHKFYLGKPGMGILYLVFCLTIIPGLAGIIEGIIYLTMTDEAFAAKYG